MRAVIQYLEEQHVQILLYLLYSPYLAGCDFWLFPAVKDRLAAMIFSYMQDLSNAVNSELRSIPQDEYHRAFTD